MLVIYFLQLRHLITSLGENIVSLALGSSELVNDDLILSRSIAIERRSLIARSAFTPTHFLASSALVRLADSLQYNVAISLEDRHQLDEQLNGLARYSAVVAASANDHRQRMLNTMGLLFAVISILFTSIAVITFAQATNSQRWAVAISGLSLS